MENPSSKHGIFENKYLIGAFSLGILLQVIVVIIPQVANIFKLTMLTGEQWLYTALISLAPLAIVEIQKKFNEIKYGKTI